MYTSPNQTPRQALRSAVADWRAAPGATYPRPQAPRAAKARPLSLRPVLWAALLVVLATAAHAAGAVL